MDLLFALYCAALFALPIILYKLSLPSDQGREKRTKDWYYALKRLLCHRKLDAFMKRPVDLPVDRPSTVADELDEDLLTFHAVDLRRNSLCLRFAVGGRTIEGAATRFAEILLQLRLADGRVLALPGGVTLHALKANEWRTRTLAITRQPDGGFRLVFNGFLRDVSGARVEHVSFNCLFSRASDTLLYPRSFDRASFGDAACRMQWKNGNWTDALGDQVGESHFGMLRGTLRSENFAIDTTLSMAAYQSRRFGTADRYEVSRSVEMLTLVEDGTLAYVENKRTAYQPSAQVRHGAVLLPNGTCAPVNACDLPLPDAHGTTSSMTVHLSTAARPIKAFVAIDDGSEVRHSGHNYELASKLAQSPTGTGCGVSSILFSRRTKTADLDESLKPLVTPADDVEADRDASLTLALDSPRARDVKLSGGKGQSLAILTSLRAKYNFTVPAGFVITTRAFDAHAQNGGALFRGAMYKLKTAFATGENVESLCKALQDVVLTTPMCSELKECIRQALKDISLKTSGNASFAVRSSGVSEDSAATSAAGQNESFLGCASDDEVLAAVVKCWASLYAFRSVEYRRNHGVDIETSMAVVVQVMVDAQNAGVLFTCDLDGNQGRMRITSNYGLGESIVSGEEGGDVVYVRRTWNDEVRVEKMEVNAKTTKILLGKEGGTRSVVLSDASAKAASIHEQEALELAKVAVRLERAYEKCLDVEWAFDASSRLVLLQARPVTFLENWTDYELLHEFDAPCMSAQNVYTTANVKEVMPGAITPLASSTVVRAINDSLAMCIAGDLERRPPLSNLILTMRHHVFIDFYKVMLSAPSDKLDLTTRSIDVSVCGHPVTTEAMLRRARAMHGRTTRHKLAHAIWDLLRSCWRIGGMMEVATSVAARRFNANGASLSELIGRIDRHLDDFTRVINAHTVASRASSFYQMFAMNLLTSEGSEARDGSELTPEKFAQIALLLSNGSGVISAEIPALLEEIAEAIRRSERRAEFVASAPERADEILGRIREADEKYRRFLEEHGHRSARELELMEKSWGSDKRALMKTLQTLAKLDDGTKKAPPMTVDEVVRRLGSNINARFLKFVIARCRAGVVDRERSKSEVVRHVNTLREGFRLLGERLYHMQMLPQPDLVYFLTYQEIKCVALGSEPALIQKAMKRKRLYGTWNAYKFPEMSEGAPRPLEVAARQPSMRAAELQGTPVCAGKVTARCCCIDDLRDVDRLRQGDVLITHGTDVAWTPYFPMLSGVVTELGGLISHGAVVAREYGLPCLVGVAGALDAFRTGDRVVLDAASGRLYKVD